MKNYICSRVTTVQEETPKNLNFDFYPTKIRELSIHPSERNEDDSDISMSDKQQTSLLEIYHRMPNEAGQLVGEGLHHDTFNVLHLEILYEQSVDYCTRELVSAFEAVYVEENAILFCQV